MFVQNLSPWAIQAMTPPPTNHPCAEDEDLERRLRTAAQVVKDPKDRAKLEAAAEVFAARVRETCRLLREAEEQRQAEEARKSAQLSRQLEAMRHGYTVEEWEAKKAARRAERAAEGERLRVEEEKRQKALAALSPTERLAQRVADLEKQLAEANNPERSTQ
jgi:hypothetical protein